MNLGQRNQVQAGGNMSSMTDLVFLLLIFFVILSTLVSNGVNVDLPQSKGTSSASSRLTVCTASFVSFRGPRAAPLRSARGRRSPPPTIPQKTKIKSTKKKT